MNLGFSQTINGQPTNFPEKIWESLGLFDRKNPNPMLDIEYVVYRDKFYKKFGQYWSSGFHTPKFHTIREDIKCRWKAGMNIHFVINSRTKDRFQFAPVVTCVSVQEIFIEHSKFSCLSPMIYIHNGKNLFNPLTYQEMVSLAKNDGFNSLDDFFKYFNKDFKGKLIHWTGLRY